MHGGHPSSKLYFKAFHSPWIKLTHTTLRGQRPVKPCCAFLPPLLPESTVGWRKTRAKPLKLPLAGGYLPRQPVRQNSRGTDSPRQRRRRPSPLTPGGAEAAAGPEPREGRVTGPPRAGGSGGGRPGRGP